MPQDDYPKQGDEISIDQIQQEEDDNALPEDSPSDTGEQSPVGGSTPVPTGESTDEMMEDVTGEEPLPGQTIADIVNKAERDRHSS